MTETSTLALPLTLRLKTQTRAAHEALDSRIMTSRPFDTRDHYALFLGMQRQFHHDIKDIYGDPRITALLPDLAQRCRLPLIERDLGDLGLEAEIRDPMADLDQDFATRLGWLYVAEGSNLGAAFLIKEAAKLGLHESFGARHLAPVGDGRGRQWKSFQAALDAAVLDEKEQARAVAGAVAAFNRVQHLADDAFTA